MSEVLWAALVGGVFGTAGTLIAQFASRQVRSSEASENNADAAVRIGEAWGALVGPLEARVLCLELENKALRGRVAELETQSTVKDEVIAAQEKRIAELEGEVTRLEAALKRLKRETKNEQPQTTISPDA